jgi:hypothetical protein
LVTADEQWNILIDQSAAGVYEWALGAALTFPARTTDATRFIRITANTGAGFGDNANKLTNALRYNASNGTALKCTSDYVFSSAANYTEIVGLQLWSTTTATMIFGGSNVSIKNCIVRNSVSSGLSYFSIVYIQGTNAKLINTLFYNDASIPNGISIEFSGAATIINCNIYSSSAATNAIRSTYADLVVDTAVFGYTNVFLNPSSESASCSNIATNAASVGIGSNHQVGLTAANQFTLLTAGSEDFRVKAGAALINNGIRQQTYTGDLDIAGGARSTTTPTIGAWEFPSVTYTFARPTSDITTQWSTSTGTDHYALIDETTANDSDYIYATAAGQTDEVKLASMSAPQAGTNLLVNYRVQGIVGSANVTMSLRQGGGGTLIATDTAKTSNDTYQLVVPAATWASVTDWTDLRLRFVSA